MPYADPRSSASRARLGALWRSLTCWYLLLSLAACATPQAPPARHREPPPASPTAPCSAGPDYPAADVALGLLLELVGEREAAAAECRARHGALVRAVTQ